MRTLCREELLCKSAERSNRPNCYVESQKHYIKGQTSVFIALGHHCKYPYWIKNSRKAEYCVKVSIESEETFGDIVASDR